MLENGVVTTCCIVVTVIALMIRRQCERFSGRLSIVLCVFLMCVMDENVPVFSFVK